MSGISKKITLPLIVVLVLTAIFGGTLFFRSASSSQPIAELQQQLADIDAELETLADFSLRSSAGTTGYRSNPRLNNHSRWVQIDLDEPARIDEIVLVPVIRRTEQNGLQADGFPKAFRVILGTADKSEGIVVAEYDETQTLLPRIAPLSVPCQETEASWIRIEVDQLSLSELNQRYVFQLAEIMAFSGHENVALHQRVRAQNNRKDGLVWDKDFLVDGFVPYLMDAASGEKSRAFVCISNKDVHPVLTIDLGSSVPLSRLHLHAIEKEDFIPQSFASDFGMPRQISIEGATQPDFQDAKTLLELDLDKLHDLSPIMMWRFPKTICRYVRFDITDLRADPFDEENSLRLGFSEIELFADGKNVSTDRLMTANGTISPKDFRRPLSHLTDGRNMYGSILPIRDWMGQLARRHELEVERPLLETELNRIFAKQKITLGRLAWLSALLAAGIALTILVNRLLRMREVQAIKERLAADLHDELGANLHTIGLLSDLAENAKDEPEELSQLHQRIRAVTERSGIAVRNCTSMFSSDGLYKGLVIDMQRSAQRIMAKLEHDFSIEGEEYVDQLERHTCFDLSLFYKECLVNISRHSGATQLRTRLKISPQEIDLTISDNGRGLPEPERNEIPASLKRRAKLLGAKITVSTPSIGGSQISLKLRSNPRSRIFS
ncbi:histidine kinase [Pelagicoccus mobilis]|uniref:histidine kinase n=1 Tax=Pelagicoccus mobilis TaxID=415221 RepID=A0A934VTV7_9BACT|nr:histidine kinase [Pelagicoccus mobilis]MBK1879904.1 hypothetical protein [Pelagicoccus mobilis]